jgi:phospho-N-acetylmuramoyl-pentapeptide-transferase
MIAIGVAAIVAFGLTIVATPLAIRLLRARSVGQFIQEEVEGHMHKRGTPTMGGLVIILAVVAGWLAGHVDARSPEGAWQIGFRDFYLEGSLVLLAFLGMGLIGLLDDYLKVSRERNLGLSKRWKFLGQLLIAGLFAWGALSADITTELSFTRPLGLELGWLYVVLVLVMLTGTANGVNLADGLDGLASGSAAAVFGAFVIISFWQFRNPGFYEIKPTLELAMMASALVAASLGFLWWNAAPARIFMGDTGSQALGGAMAALALLTNTHLLLPILGGLYVAETLSVVIQVVAYRRWGRRVFRMAPFHHHFELTGWPETTVIIRFWIVAIITAALALGLFYGDFITHGGVGG